MTWPKRESPLDLPADERADDAADAADAEDQPDLDVARAHLLREHDDDQRRGRVDEVQAAGEERHVADQRLAARASASPRRSRRARSRDAGLGAARKSVLMSRSETTDTTYEIASATKGARFAERLIQERADRRDRRCARRRTPPRSAPPPAAAA